MAETKIKAVIEKMNFAKAEINRIRTGKGKIPVLKAED